MSALKLDNWITIVRKKQWRWARKIATESLKWSTKAHLWNPHVDHQWKAHRNPGRQKKRWSDNITEYIKAERNGNGNWFELAADQQAWRQLEKNFVKSER